MWVRMVLWCCCSVVLRILVMRVLTLSVAVLVMVVLMVVLVWVSADVLVPVVVGGVGWWCW